MHWNGTIDPIIPNKEGRFIPAQSILVALEGIRIRGRRKAQTKSAARLDRYSVTEKYGCTRYWISTKRK